jgi:diaminohydroxyphosphoribosylaminopyrimidine deaminase/5-amino-6-(5-phosphoribosylamino)uracil reductase
MTIFSAIDHAHMAHALQLAERGLFTTQPNPRVGCVIAHGDEIVGMGFHQRAGEPHAEVFALREAGERARGATVYVTLEPCAHYGRTPPCAEALVKAGVTRVVVAAEDPNPHVAGRGMELLRAAGIAVDPGLLHDAARELNPGFFSRFERGRPWLRVKLAMSLDGRTALANGESKWITGAAARADVQRWRARSSAILTGSGTVLADNPHLTVRLPLNTLAPGTTGQADRRMPRDSLAPGATGQADRRVSRDSLSPGATGGEGRGGGAALAADPTSHPATPPSCPDEPCMPPLRVVLDSRLRTPAGRHVLDGVTPTLLLHAPGAASTDQRFARVELATIAERDGALDLAAVLALLAARGCNEVQVEAGPTLCGALFAAGLVDELLLYIAPLLLGDRAQPLLHLPALADMAQRWRLQVLDQRQVGADWRLRLRPT